jgi:hypothetical protein
MYTGWNVLGAEELLEQPSPMIVIELPLSCPIAVLSTP